MCKKRILLFFMLFALVMNTLLYSNMSFAGEKYKLFRAHFKKGKLTYSIVSGNSSIALIAATKWNDISKLVKLSYTSKSGEGDINIICNITEPLVESTYGETILFSGDKIIAPTDSKILSSVLCIQYKHSDFKNDTQRIATTVHEIGHALSLSHPIESVSLNESIMKQGLKSYTKPTELDELALCRAASMYWATK